VLHFAATMGGMGTIHEANDFMIYAENHTMTRNILEASISAGVKQFFYASTACVYPEHLQTTTSCDVSLREDDVWAYLPPKPQGLYGLEKLMSELLIQQMAPKLDIRIARFHNVYGPHGAWRNGREKAPAALLRKAFAIQSLPDHFELWGDGSQRRSFLFIDDAVEAVFKLIHSHCITPINIGSDDSVTLQTLAEIALSCAGVASDTTMFQYDQTKPIGVASRNSNNDAVWSKIQWKPKTSLTDGMRLTSEWIRSEFEIVVQQHDDPQWRINILKEFQASQLVNLASEKIVFAILLPITSQGSTSPEHCLEDLKIFAKSLNRSTWRDIHSLGGTQFHVKVYLAIDHDDSFLLSATTGLNRAESILHEAGLIDVVTLECKHPRGHVCELWRDCAKQAWIDHCDYMSLMGEDVILKDEGWMRDIHTRFTDIATIRRVPFGFGCVAFTDTSFPGMPTFPVVHRTHMDIFDGVVVPNIFVNQDGDPFLFQLYRRWDCSEMFESRITNGIGGSGNARYTKISAKDWTFSTLDDAATTALNWLQANGSSATKMLTLDVIIPCYRVDLEVLASVLNLKPSSSCSVMFIIIVDNPQSPHIAELETRYAARPDVRIRRNDSNLGASASRNRGMQESSADWVHFLDDDVVPDHNLLINAEKIIRENPRAAGLIGNTIFPCADTIFKTAVHLAGVTYFWDIATKFAVDLPWGVTANLIARRVNDGVIYNTSYPKTGGGEDIDFCRNKRHFSMQNGGMGFVGAPNVIATHPWWNGGVRSYWRFYMWSFGDGALIKKFPELTYRDIAPNSAELLLLCLANAWLGLVMALLVAKWSYLFCSLLATFLVIAASVLHDCYRHLWKNPERVKCINSSVSGLYWFLAVIESSFIRIFSEVGRLHGVLSRGEVTMILKRFDWFAGRAGNGPRNEEMLNNFQRLGLTFMLLYWSLSTSSAKLPGL
jgi:nucleoside-diphosphate-sugar epimerase/glycosyltransferase involved in cell wall biosynthesis